MRSDRDLLDATREFARELPARTWLELASTLSCGAVFAAAAVLFGGAAGWIAACVLGLVNVRLFIFYHDALHGTVFRKSAAGRAIMWIYGLLILTPPRIWRETHNYHHAHTSKLVSSSIGSFPIMTVRMYQAARPLQRIAYRASRHPVTILLGYPIIFLTGMCVKPLFRSPRRYWDGAAAIGLHAAIIAMLQSSIGLEAVLRAYLVPLALSSALGAYLFYAQHNFPGARVFMREDWAHASSALEGSSMMTMGPVMRWFTGCIGYHHVHHLNPRIPFYRLKEAMEAIPELQRASTTSLRPRDVLACLRLGLWDPQAEALIPFPSGRAAARSSGVLDARADFDDHRAS